MTALPPRQTLLTPDTPVDLDNCAREPIHIPGRVQPRGCLLVVRSSDLTVVQCSVNVAELLGRPSETLLGSTLREGLGTYFEGVVRRHLAAGPRLHDRNPLLVAVEVDGQLREMDAILHRIPLPDDLDDSLLVIELEPAEGLRPFTFANTYQAVRDAVNDLNRVSSLAEVFDIAARHVRDLTGFDRVMIYAFDEDYNGEVVAEVHREGLNSFLGLHYPATDIPAQARALYEKNWIRLISDVDYVPSEIVPTANPITGAPLDLTHATLRSVSPIHLEYLGNMGVRASMSISLLRDGKLWGLIACHHYSGPHEPPFGVRAAAEFLGSTLSLRLVAQVEEDRLAASQRAAGMLADLVARSRDEELPLGQALTGSDLLLDLVQADGVVVFADDQISTRGETPDAQKSRELAEWVLEQDDDLVRTDSIVASVPELAGTDDAAGLLGITLPDGQAVVWLRHEATRDVDWGGDPHNKTIERLEDDSVRLSPRKSFERWREVVRDHSIPWQDDVVVSATSLRAHLVEALYLRGQRDLRSAQAMQRSMLPSSLPQPTGWQVTARYEPADGGRVGGDWYDALVLPSGRLAAVVGDVAGHGLPAAASMGQLRNALRAILVGSESPARSIAELDRVARWTLPDQYATVLVAVLDLATGEVEYSCAGHLPPLLLAPDSSSTWDRSLGTPPLGILDSEPATRRVTVPKGGGIALFSDGLVERRTESIVVGVERLQSALAGGAGVDGAMELSHAADSNDDATLLLLCRDEDCA
ncbi:SpoIIE family protein phosphatase [Sanguibacter sp. Leaf3]|uniref:SpoIIE family protein phosphatase n=1 Tax=Sanguibacter sp. Leaf3 TaxID=1736209 RepID=UPI0006F9093C|nr:SpoIIE family protein phosphatase [Sanguibacter sp. Leaf3]KQT97819.1 histidine kinase [Sanguibacter sp. Leaf3]